MSYGYVRLSAAASTARVIDVCPLYQFVLDCRALAPPRVLSDLRCQAPARPPAVRHPSPGTFRGGGCACRSGIAVGSLVAGGATSGVL